MKESSRNAGEIQKREITWSALGTGRQTLHQDVETDEDGVYKYAPYSETDLSDCWRRCKLDPQANTATN